MTRPAGNHSISPASGYYGVNWPANGAIPQSFSMGGWTSGNIGFVQQTFLGASIRSFTMNGGFGDSSSQLSVELINDEFNKSDQTDSGLGDDVYHSGMYDNFSPPPVGSPVFFKFGMNHATVEEAYKKTFDDIYNSGTSTLNDYPPKIIGKYNKNNFTTLDNGQYVDIENNNIIDNSEFLNSDSRGKDHLIFGGILQSYVQNRGLNGNPLYSIQVVDPREILSNTILILNNYAGTIYKHSNMFNIYGFLEYNPTESLEASLSGHYPYKSILQKNIKDDGSYDFSGYDMYASIDGLNTNYNFSMPENVTYDFGSNFPPRMPITGTGYARRSSQGIPYYRLRQGLNALLGIDGPLPKEYITAGFGGYINFRGFNYVVDLSGLKNLNDYYFFDFDQMNLLDLCLEICDITSSDLFVTLLPIIDHPSCSRFYKYNNSKMQANKPKEIIAGIIRVDAIDRSKQPEYGSIKKYIDSLATSGIFVENQDVGFELSNVTTDKFIVGAQEVDMYYFSTNADRDDLEVRKQKAGLPNKVDSLLGDQWKLETSLKQQILPYYGLLGNHNDRAITIPKGFGAYQQILLDSTGLNANGVGNYYVATELELRTALISYERWVDFLLMYNDIYMESFESDDAFESALLVRTAKPPAGAPAGVQVDPNISNNYGVSVPRSVFDTDSTNKFGIDELPSSPCNPPYGYPLYYKRATKIGIASAGLAGIQAKFNTILTNLAELSGASTDEQFTAILNSQWNAYKDGTGPNGAQSQEEIDYYNWIDSLRPPQGQGNATKTPDIVGLIDNTLTGLSQSFKILDRLSKKTKENSLKVYNFVKQVAEECLGRKFLVKIPKEVNLFYSSNLQVNDPTINEYLKGPFGFRPRSINYDPAYEYSNEFKTLIDTQINSSISYNHIQTFLTKEDNINYSLFQGALKGNWNAISETYEFNYEPSKQGGYINFDLFENVSNKTSLGVAQGFIPQDLKNFMNENRISAYVRFDNSQYLALDGLSPDSFTQQLVVAGNYIPDITHELDNIKADKFIKFPESTDATKPKTVAFVKCDIDDKFYIAPKTEKKSVNISAQHVKDIGKYTKPSKIYDCATNSYQNSFSYYEAHYVPTTQSGVNVEIVDFKRNFNSTLNGNIIDTEEKNLDTDHVYALITLPSRISPTMDSRFKDGTFQHFNPAVYKHILSLDVVKGLKGFDIPTFYSNPSNIFNRFNLLLPFDQQVIDYATSAYNAATKALKFSFPQRINAAVPSPVYPDLVVLPLLSKERCYGPWVSSQCDVQAKVYQNIAGKVDFIKDENLAPWNYNGYQLMNAAGILQAEFSNSLLLQSERGGFVIPSAPFGISLGKNLLNVGPLVTNISVDISNNGVHTTYKMDLYTAKFGKLQKQKQDLVSKISRERQKLQDERNALIRKGLGKNATVTNYQSIYNNVGSLKNQLRDGLPDIFNTNDSILTGSIVSNNNIGITARTASTYGSNNTIESKSYQTNASFQSTDSISDMASILDPLSLSQEYYNTAGGSLASMYYPSAKEVAHNNMPHVYNPNIEASKKIYSDIDNFNNDKITTYEV